MWNIKFKGERIIYEVHPRYYIFEVVPNILSCSYLYKKHLRSEFVCFDRYPTIRSYCQNTIMSEPLSYGGNDPVCSEVRLF